MRQPFCAGGRVRCLRAAAALLIVGCIAASGVLFSPAGAGSGGNPGAWILSETTGPVDVQTAEGAPWTAAETGAMLPGPATVRTGPDGGATLTRDDDRIVLSASTTVRLPGPDLDDSATRIVQPEGEAFFEVGPRPGWTFSVDTPYLAVVVKGTKFGVDVSEAGTSVAVSEGRVQVDRPGSDPADVSAGQTARSGAAPGSDISIGVTPESSAAAPEAAVDADSLASGTAEADTSAAEAGESASNGSGAEGGGSSNGNSGGASAGSSGGASAGSSSGTSAGNSGGASDGGSPGNSAGNGASNGNGKSKPGKGQGKD
jgi:hypothetical protein